MNEEFSLVYSVSNSVFIEPRQRIINRLLSFLKDNLLEERILKVKISADGTNISRSLSIINFTFTILNESKKAKKASGNYTLGITKLNEDYIGLEEPIKYLINSISGLNQIEF